jgi:hypothetical protein
MKALALFGIPLALAAGALMACAESAPVTRGPVSTPQEVGARPLILSTLGGLQGTGTSLADLLRQRYPSYDLGRLAVGWDSRATWLFPLGQGMAERWRACLLLSDLGVLAANADQAYVQLDPATFSGLIWIAPRMDPSGDMAAIDISLRSTRGSAPADLTVACDPPLALRPHADGGASGEARPWLKVPTAPTALFTEQPSGHLWIAWKGTIERMDPRSQTVLQSWPSPTTDSDSSVPQGAIVADVGGESDTARVGFFDPQSATGWWFLRQPDGSFIRGEALAAYPLTDRLTRFLTAPFDPQAGLFQLTDYKGDLLGSFKSMVRFLGPTGSLFAMVGDDGTLSVLRGDELSLMIGPTSKAATAVASSGRLLFVATLQPRPVITAYRLGPDSVWEYVWSSSPMTNPINALCVGNLGGRPVLLAGLAEGESGEIVSVQLPLGLISN